MLLSRTCRPIGIIEGLGLLPTKSALLVLPAVDFHVIGWSSKLRYFRSQVSDHELYLKCAKYRLLLPLTVLLPPEN